MNSEADQFCFDFCIPEEVKALIEIGWGLERRSRVAMEFQFPHQIPQADLHMPSSADKI